MREFKADHKSWVMQRPLLPWQFSLPPQWVASMGSSTDKMISATVNFRCFFGQGVTAARAPSGLYQLVTAQFAKQLL